MSETATFDLPAALTIASVEALHEKLEPLSIQGADVVVNGEGVERVDTAGLQLLLAFKQSLTKHNAGFKWQTPSQLLCEAADQLGLAGVLALQEQTN